jgi:N-formylmaleamate deformylase
MKTTPAKHLGFAAILILGAILPQAFAQSQNNEKTLKTPAEARKASAAFAVKISGHGSPIIFIPGMSSSGDTWTTTTAHFQDQHTCYVLTLAGFAGQAPIQAPLLSTVREELAAYIETHHLKKPVIVGHSLGGDIALDLAAHHPEIVGPLVIVDSLPFLAGAWFQVKTADEAKPMIARMRSYMAAQTREQYEQYVRSAASTKYMVTSPADLQVITQWGLASDQATVSEAMYEMLGQDLRDDVSHIASPVLVLGSWSGLKDQLEQNGVKITQEQVAGTFQEQYARLPHLHFVMAEAARHFIMWDDPKWFFQQLDSFLADPVTTAGNRGFAGK